MEQERVRQGLSLQKLGTISGVNRTTIGLIEKGQRSPSLHLPANRGRLGTGFGRCAEERAEEVTQASARLNDPREGQ
ncbi:helix-turn-helix transcriptional regulator [Methylocella tundrae]